MNNIVIVVAAVALAGYLAFSKRLAGSAGWKATVTPLASIMGSGFLVSAPLLAGVVGDMAVVFMAVLLLLAYFVGSAIRFNIRYFEPIENVGHGPVHEVAWASRIVLSGAYFVSVSYYLQLLAAFALSFFGIHDQLAANIITTCLLLIIGGIGIRRGLGEMETVEQYAVSLNLGVIGALLVALMLFNGKLLAAGSWQLPQLDTHIDVHSLRVVLGLLIVVQGFETSRFLGDEHPPELRIRTMRNSQLISGFIYIVFIGLATVLFRDDFGADVTAIMGMTRPVAVVLPLLIGIAAVGSQFSAAVADCEGAGGLIEDISERKLSMRYSYMLVLMVTIVLTWQTNVNQIIAYASRAFALFYALQGLVAFLVARQNMELPHRRLHLVTFAVVMVLCLGVFACGVSSE